jgi:hypothetical protein
MTKRNAKRQLAAIYSHSGRRRLRGGGGSKQSRSRSSKRARIRNAVKNIRTALDKYSDLELRRFIQQKKSLIFGSQETTANAKAIHTMQKLYELLKIDDATTTPKPQLTDDIVIDIVNSSCSSIQTPQAGGQERPNIWIRRALMALVLSVVGLFILSDTHGQRRVTNMYLLALGAWLVQLVVPNNGHRDGHHHHPHPDPHPHPPLPPLPPLHPLPHPHHHAGPDSFKLIKNISDMPLVGENLNTCGICAQLLVESDPDNALKNLNGYIVQLHPGQGPVPHLYHFKCIRVWFKSRLDLGPLTRCLVDGIDIDGSALVGMLPDDKTAEAYFTSLDGMHFFHNASGPPPGDPSQSSGEINDEIDRKYAESLRIDTEAGFFEDAISPRTPHPSSGASPFNR